MVDVSCRLIVPSPDSDIKVTIALSWSLSTEDASCWKRPLTLSISPNGGGEAWETYLYLSREEGRLLRDYLSVMLASPDLRQAADGGPITLHSGQSAV